MISFRLTAFEYDRCRELCSAHGMRGVSELARTAINQLLQQKVRAVPEPALESRVADLEVRLRILAHEITRLGENSHLIDPIYGTARNHADSRSADSRSPDS
jgi:hypothetical protein